MHNIASQESEQNRPRQETDEKVGSPCPSLPNQLFGARSRVKSSIALKLLKHKGTQVYPKARQTKRVSVWQFSSYR